MKYVREIIISAILPLFYLFCIVCIVGAVFYFHAKNIEQQQMILEIEKRLTLNSTGDVTTLPVKDNIDSSKLTYTVQDENVAVVHDDGTVVAVGEGTTAVTVETDDNSKLQTIVVSVGKEAINETKSNKQVDNIIEDVNKEIEESTKVEKVPVTSLSLNKEEVALSYNETFSPSVTVFPDNASNRRIIWTSSNPDLVSVSEDGVIKAVKNEDGIATVWATTENKLNAISLTIPVIRKIIEAIGIKIDRLYVNLKANESTNLVATLLPSGAVNTGIEWSSSNPNLVTVDQNGKVTAVANEDGIAIITAATSDEKHKAISTVRVSKVEEKVSAEGVTLDKSSIQLKYGEKAYLSATVTPQNATNKLLIWTSDNPTLVYVNMFGRVRALRNENGSATITVRTLDGLHKATARVDVIQDSIKVSRINLNRKTVDLNIGQSFQLFASILPFNATDKKIIWKSSSPNYVPVDGNGLVTVKDNQTGSAIITATSEDGSISSSAQIKVKKTDVSVTGIQLSNTSYNLKYGEKATMVPNVLPETASNKQVTYSSSNPKLVAINSNGVITVISNENGSATITATTKDGSHKATAQVNVSKVVVDNGKVELSASDISLAYGEKRTITANRSVTWSSSDTSIATVNSKGLITANKKKLGIATITAKKGNISASLKVRVYPSGKAVSYKATYKGYKTGILIKNRQRAVLQSFAFDGNDIYISQQQGIYQPGATLSKMTNLVTPVTNSAILKNYDHVSNISIETTNNVKYLWTDCGSKNACRVRLDAISFSNPPVLQSPAAGIYESNGPVAVDSDNRIFAILAGNSRKTHIFKIYNLDDFIKNGTKAELVYEFTVRNPNTNYHRQGFTVSGNYIYDYEGNRSDGQYPAVFLSTFSLQGQKIVSRRKIAYPNNKYYWEPEGVKIRNGKVYIGMGGQNKETNKKYVALFQMNQ